VHTVPHAAFEKKILPNLLVCTPLSLELITLNSRFGCAAKALVAHVTRAEKTVALHEVQTLSILTW
jgi:hypothetical protein